MRVAPVLVLLCHAALGSMSLAGPLLAAGACKCSSYLTQDSSCSVRGKAQTAVAACPLISHCTIRTTCQTCAYCLCVLTTSTHTLTMRVFSCSARKRGVKSTLSRPTSVRNMTSRYRTHAKAPPPFPSSSSSSPAFALRPRPFFLPAHGMLHEMWSDALYHILHGVYSGSRLGETWVGFQC